MEYYLSDEDIADIILCLKYRREHLLYNIRLYSRLIKENKEKDLELFENLVSRYRNELERIDLLILEFQDYCED